MTTGKVHYNFCIINFPWKWLTMALEAHGPSSFKVEIRDPKIWSSPTKTGLANNFWKLKFSPGCTVEAANAPQTLFMDTLSPGLGLWPDKVYHCEDALKLPFNKICLKMIGHGSRITRGPGPSRSRLQAKKHDLPTLKQDWPTSFFL